MQQSQKLESFGFILGVFGGRGSHEAIELAPIDVFAWESWRWNAGGIRLSGPLSPESMALLFPGDNCQKPMP